MILNEYIMILNESIMMTYPLYRAIISMYAKGLELSSLSTYTRDIYIYIRFFVPTP